MDIPEEVRQARRARMRDEYPAMARHPELFDQFVDAELQDEWSRTPSYKGIAVEVKCGHAVISFDRASTGNAISVMPTMPEIMDLWTKLGSVLGL